MARDLGLLGICDFSKVMMHFQNYFGQWVMPWLVFWPLALVGGFILVLLIVWSFIWKGMALWHSARKGEKVWFVVFLVVNTLGILEILYLYVFSKKAKKIE